MTISTHELLMELLEKSNQSTIDKAIELAVAVSLSATAVPKGAEIDALSKMNPKTPVYFATVQRYEDRMNEHLGICEATGRPLVPRMRFISDMIQQYMRITPSTGKSEKNRAEMVLETMQKGALVRQPDLGTRLPFLPSAEEVPESSGKFK